MANTRKTTRKTTATTAASKTARTAASKELGSKSRSASKPRPRPTAPVDTALDRVTAALQDIEASTSGGGTVELPDGARVGVTHLGKKLWPALGITKGELMRHYVSVAAVLLPVLEDRPLIMRRFPSGVGGPAFYQQRAPTDPPPDVRVMRVDADKEVPTRLVGGSLATLLYMTQLASISQDPWFSRVQSIDDIDFAVIDLDPLEGTPFATVVEVAQWVHEQLDALGVEGFPKTSGASGLHIYIPMRPTTPYDSGLLFCQLVATLVARKHPAIATVERAVLKRPAGSVYIDYLQNIRGKSIACAYSARASAFAGVSTPLRWSEVVAGLDPSDFTVRTFAARLRAVGDLWLGLRRSKGVDLQAALERAHASGRKTSGKTPG
jgi:bifunctional non-homologous end joining protein LigD